MALDPTKNFAITTVATAPSPASSGTTLVVATGDGAKFPAPSTDGAFNVIIFPEGEQPDASNAEIVRVTGRTTDTLTITRTQEGTSARTIGTGDIVMLGLTDKMIDDIVTEINARIPKTTNITALNETGIADGEIAVFNLTNKDIRTSNVLISTDGTLAGNADTNLPTEKAVKTYVDASKFVFKGAWVTSTSYILNDVVQENGSGYVCTTAHTSGTFATDLGAGKWALLVEGVGGNSIQIDCSGGTSDTYGALSGLVNGSNTVYTVSLGSYISGSLRVYLNGQLQTQGSSEDWVETAPASGTFTFATAPVSGDIITAIYQFASASTGNADTLDGLHSSSFAPESEWNDGWIAVGDTWSYASATTITVPSGAASKYQKGDKIKLTQTTVKYFYVVSVADTVLTVTGGSDYTVANAAITSPYVSHVLNPVGFPQWFNFTPSWTNLTPGSGTNTGRFTIEGKTVHLTAKFIFGTGSSVGSAPVRMAMPVAVEGTASAYSIGTVLYLDTGTASYMGFMLDNGDCVLTSGAGTYSSTVYITTTTPMTWTTGDALYMHGHYELD